MVSITFLTIVAILGYTSASPSSKIDPALRIQFETKALINLFVTMREGTEEILEFVSNQPFSSRTERLNAIVGALKLFRDTNQRDVLRFLDQESADYTSFWISNQIYIRNAPIELALQLQEFPEVVMVAEEAISRIEEPDILNTTILPPGSIRETQWGISKIQADRVWGTAGHTGLGVVVGIIDTGVRGTHQDLVVNYRTPYGWRDPSNTTPGATPNDGNGHGTHCLGSIIGSNGIGVAPGARWVACKGCTSSFCLNSDLILCGEWMLCPTLPDGTSPDCSKAPHLVSNSWAGGRGNTFYNPIVNAWKAARIVPIFGQGNSGPSCETALSPADSDVIGVGATDSGDNLASFSSKGPSMYGTLKPDISAPGAAVYSSHNSADNGYATMSGTSMATPHVAGAVALILSRQANMTYEEVKTALFRGVDTTMTACTYACGGIPGTTYPNNCYGRGRLNVFNSIEAMDSF